MKAAARLELVALSGIGAIGPGDDLGQCIADALSRDRVLPSAGDVFVVAQKIVSKSEDRFVILETIVPTQRAVEIAAKAGKDARLVELVLRESRQVLRVAPGVIICEDKRGLVLANAGIDQSNVEKDDARRERALLLPEDPDSSADRMRRQLEQRLGVQVGVIINDSLGRAWRLGTCGTAIGVSGLPGLLDRRGEVDLYGRTLQATEVAIADELAAAASALMGQAAEGTPVVLIRGAAWPRRGGNAKELQRPLEKDLFR